MSAVVALAALGWGLAAACGLAWAFARTDLAVAREHGRVLALWLRAALGRPEPPPLPAPTAPVPLVRRFRAWTRAWRRGEDLPAFWWRD